MRRKQFSFLISLFWLLVLGGCAVSRSPMPSRVPTAALPTAVSPTAVTLPSPAPSALAVPESIALLPTPTTLPTPTPVLAQMPSPTAVLTVTMPVSSTAAPTLPQTSGGQAIGQSVEGRPIVAYRFGDGPVPVVFVGGLHGGYEWNTITLAYQAIDYFTAHPEQLPENITLHIIPSANPDGQFLVTQEQGRFTATDVLSDTIPGRFNANGVDLNRNWDCDWAGTAVWRDNVVSGGARPFSEAESVVLRDYILAQRPTAVIFWHSAADGVFVAGCPEPDAQSLTLATVYGEAADYRVYERFTSYPITGDAGDWLTTQAIPSFSVELSSHEAEDWPQNLAGMRALLQHFDGGEQ